MSNYQEFMDALRAERQHELRQQAAQGLNQRHLLKPDTRLVPLPPNPVQGFFESQPAWITQIDTLLFTPELYAAFKSNLYANDRANSSVNEFCPQPNYYNPAMDVGATPYRPLAQTDAASSSGVKSNVSI